jgi:DNA-binding XRE family transcriptional regulator
MNRYIIGKTKEELYSNIDYYNNYYSKNQLTTKNSGMFSNKYSLEEYIRFKNENPTLSATELADLLGVCKKTIYNYESSIPNPTFIKKEEVKYKIINTQTLEEQIVNAKEGGKYFNISDSQFRKTEKYHRDHSSLYKKKYKIIRLNNL